VRASPHYRVVTARSWHRRLQRASTDASSTRRLILRVPFRRTGVT
jgi:hypothetical protein